MQNKKKNKKLTEGEGFTLAQEQPLGLSIGALLGVIPQCGFSVMAACLYRNSSISLGTLTAVFFATSDEAIPMLLIKGIVAMHDICPLLANHKLIQLGAAAQADHYLT